MISWSNESASTIIKPYIAFWNSPGIFKTGNATFIIPNNNIPKNFVIPFNLKDALLLQEASENSGTYKEMSVNITSNDNNNDLKYDFIFVKRY